ncbi:DUF5994 family protein [Kibdelosporangium phytohabitans]|uniref:Uncharacterized protein n=1 Tax=Kibdelosporangium phytohabitans TaxID=860235 RepID=A0A0N9I1Q9_9PSEU|nr:DUF5994 family protein [Kibdelosporangium phytohabitans]ALG09774.1 hypothetical protein AOZ06_25305 [Kibdelosporangium phytohabitans]MBE1468851.1 hypothetical protein [Kibdelosporangium phytohabitans]
MSQPRSLRLITKADGAVPSRFDGGWWPRSPDLVTELPILVRALTPQLGLVRRIGYNPDVWGLLARHMTVDGYTARLEGFTGLDPYSLRITGVTGTMLCLLIVPPDAPEHMGQSALTAACTQNGLSRQILSACGVISYS